MHNVGDIMYDAALHYGNRPDRVQTLSPALRTVHAAADYILATIHRQENTDDPVRLERIVTALLKVADAHPVVLPLHPRTRSRLAATWLSRLQSHPAVHLTDPLGYLDLVRALRDADLVLTDSGGLQKEAYWYGVPCVTMRPSTEWIDTVTTGANVLVDDDPDRIATAIAEARMPTDRPLLYGDGHASERIASVLAGTIPRHAH